jgi:hypothetical protein
MGPKLTQAEGFILGVGAKMFFFCVHGASVGAAYRSVYKNGFAE